MRRPRLQALLCAWLYAAGIVALPVLHRLHHLRHGADHVHTATGTIYFPHDADAHDDDDDDENVADHDHDDHDHDDHDHDDHDHDHHHDHHHTPFDPSHGDGAPEHLGASLLSARSFVLPPPVRPFQCVILPHPPRGHASAPLLTHRSRGPPPPSEPLT